MEVTFSSSTKISSSAVTCDQTIASSSISEFPSDVGSSTISVGAELEKTASFGSMLIDNELVQSEQIQLRELLDETEDTWYPLFDSERLIIGETVRDNTCQTEPSEIEDIKLLMAQAESLKGDRDSIRDSQKMTWQTVDAIYHKNISEKATAVSTKMLFYYFDNVCS